ncbi:MAG TPA: hypothetical protein PLW35_12160, partial [Verrucomicrobiota bacterium]|nr:hypothetical protein [Verrucomicrobiota bacterium]
SKRGIGSVVGLMRPRTAALPTVGVSSNAPAGARRFFAAPSRFEFGGPIWGMKTGRMTGHRADGEYGIWGQARCLGRKTKRQQAAALQTLRAYHRPLHPRLRGRNHRDQRRGRMGPYGDRHGVCGVRGAPGPPYARFHERQGASF